MKYGYIRVSTKEQNEDRQLDFMKKNNIHSRMVFMDKATGKNFDRPQYQEMKKHLQEGDEIYIMAIDRLGRNKEQTLFEMREFKRAGIILHAGDVPTSMVEVDENNRSIMEMVNNILIEVFTTLAEEELKRIKKRQKEGMEAMPVCKTTGKKKSRKTGKVVGRPNKIKSLSKEDQRQVNAWINKTIKLSDCIKITGLSESTLYRIKKEGVEVNEEIKKQSDF